jgi:hypothetical protein
MQSMRPQIPPETIQPNLCRRRPRARHLKHPRRDPKPSIRGDDLEAGHPFCKLTTLRGCHTGTILRVCRVEGVGLGVDLFG